jgi:hypothetical protein
MISLMNEERASAPNFNVGTVTPDEQRRMNMRLESMLQDETALLRADIAQKFNEQSIDGDGERWAIFKIDYEGDSDGSTQVVGPTRKDILVYLLHPDEPGHEGEERPLIRIVTNESYRTGEDIEGDDYLEWFSTDFSLDAENDSQYFVDFNDPNKILKKDRVDDPERPFFEYQTVDDIFLKLATDAGFGPLFWAGSDNALYIENFDMNAPVGSTTGKLDSGAIANIIPFGSYKSTYDKLYAVARAREVLEQVKFLQPERSSAYHGL